MELLNELREGVLTRPEYEAKHEALTADTNAIRERFVTDIGHVRDDIAKLEQAVAVGPPEIQHLERFRSEEAGARRTAAEIRTMLLAWLAIAVSIATAVVLIVHG